MGYKTVETYAKEMSDDEMGVKVIPLGLSESGKTFKFEYRFYVRKKLCITTFFCKKVYSDNHDVWIEVRKQYYYIRYSSITTGEVLYDWEEAHDTDTEI